MANNARPFFGRLSAMLSSGRTASTSEHLDSDLEIGTGLFLSHPPFLFGAGIRAQTSRGLFLIWVFAFLKNALWPTDRGSSRSRRASPCDTIDTMVKGYVAEAFRKRPHMKGFRQIGFIEAANQKAPSACLQPARQQLSATVRVPFWGRTMVPYPRLPGSRGESFSLSLRRILSGSRWNPPPDGRG